MESLESFNKFELQSDACPSKNRLLSSLEDDMIDQTKSIKFQKMKDPFFSKLNQDLKNIKFSNELFDFADKSTNLYATDVKYKKMLTENIQEIKSYKKANDIIADDINRDAKSVAKPLNVNDKMDKLASKDAFITLKDHKANFLSNPKCRLINSSKNEIGIISKKK